MLRNIVGFRKLLNLLRSETLSLILKSGEKIDSLIILNDNSCRKIAFDIFIEDLND